MKPYLSILVLGTSPGFSAEPGDAEAILQILHMESELPEEPVSPQIILQDTTPEALGKMMGDHNGRVALFSDEGGIFDIFD